MAYPFFDFIQCSILYIERNLTFMEEKNTPVDITKISINTELPQKQRIDDFIKQIKNPYDFLCYDYRIKIKFSENSDVTIQDVLKRYYEMLQNQ